MTRRSSLDPRLLAGWCDAAVAGYADTYAPGTRELHRITANARVLFEHYRVNGVDRWDGVTADLTLERCWAAFERPDGERCVPAPNTARNRQLEARALFKIAAALGAAVDPDAAVGPIIAKPIPDVAVRLLTNDEMERITIAAEPQKRTSAKPLLVAFARSGATAADTAAVRRKDVDLAAGTVTFKGPPKRVCALDPLGRRAVARYLAANRPGPDALLCVKADLAPDAAAHAVVVRLWDILNDAGIASGSGATPRSIRLTAARRVLERDGIAAAAMFLGSSSLDTTAALLGHRWRHGPASVETNPADETAQDDG